jgi:hypothetical protein
MSHSFADRSIRELEPMLIGWVSKLVEKLAQPAANSTPADMLKWYNCATFGMPHIISTAFQIAFTDSIQTSWLTYLSMNPSECWMTANIRPG